jgi:hypothetical protein
MYLATPPKHPAARCRLTPQCPAQGPTEIRIGDDGNIATSSLASPSPTASVIGSDLALHRS